MNELSMSKKTSSIITVIGVGGAGGNALDHMWRMGIKDVNFLACNTDARALDNLSIPNEDKIVMGPGLGAGNDPEQGRRFAMEAEDQIREYLVSHNTEMVFIAAGITVVYTVEQLPLPMAILIHGGVLYVDYLLMYLLNDWIPKGGIGIFTLIFGLGYAAVWLVIYLSIRIKAAQINKKLHS